MLQALRDVAQVMTRRRPRSGSNVVPTGVTCTSPDWSMVVSVAKCRSVRKEMTLAGAFWGSNEVATGPSGRLGDDGGSGAEEFGNVG